MLKSDTKALTCFKMPTTTDYYILSKTAEEKKVKEFILMTSITEEDEGLLDTGEPLFITRRNHDFSIDLKDVYCYGIVDFHTGSEDMLDIDDFDFFHNLSIFEGIRLPSDYDYESHCCYSPIKVCRYYETWSSAKVAQYAHGCLGKPERIVLFKCRQKTRKNG